MKVVVFYLSCCCLFIFTICKSSALVDTATNTVLKTKIFVIRQAIEKLKKEISSLANDDSGNQTKPDTEAQEEGMRLNVKQNENQDKGNGKDDNEMDAKKDEKSNEEIDDLEKQKVDNADNENKELADVHTHHPEKIDTGDPVLFFSQNKVGQSNDAVKHEEKNNQLPSSMSYVRESISSDREKDPNQGLTDKNATFKRINNIPHKKVITNSLGTNGPLKENEYLKLKFRNLANNLIP